MGVRDLAQVAHHLRDDAILPLARCHVHEAIQLVGRDGLGAEVNDRGLLPAAGLGVLQDLPQRGLEAPWIAHQKDAMPNAEQLDELRDLEQQVPARVVCVSVILLHDLNEDLLHLVVPCAWHIDAREQVGEQAHEDLQVVALDLRHVRVAQGTHQHRLLRERRVGPLEAACDDEHALDGAHAPIVLLRGRQEVLVQGVQRGKLQAQRLGLKEALSHEHVLDDQLEIRHHDGDRAEQRLQTLW
mmetsp:Transcript_91658/g.264351  ORF Transcript_91658/g.264351 Transcript_91658/m.264351 type:complete len:242 (-) Transcript_91658:198-923(-)